MERGRFVVNSGSLVTVDAHGTVTLVVGDSSSVGAVDGDLVVVSTESVSVGIRVREQTALEHLVQRGFHTRHQVRGREGSLLSFSEVVFGVSVQDQLTDGNQGVVTMGPDLGNVENVPLVLVTIVNGHGLDVEGPRSATTLSDVLEEIFSGVVGVGGLEGISFTSGEVLDTRIGLEVELDPVSFTLFIDPLEGVGGVTVHSSETIRSTSVGHQDSNLVSRFRNLREEVPEHVGTLEIGLGVSLLGVDEIREFNRVSDEEDGGVVTNHIPIAFFSIELDGETTGITFGISGTLFTTDGGESGEDGSSLADGFEDLSLAELGDVVGDFQITPSTSTLGMDDSFRDSFSVEVG